MTDHPVKRRKKMIEVAIPLEAINAASAREKSIRHAVTVRKDDAFATD